MTPYVSVVIRSYERGAAVIELIEAVLRQRDVPSFEIVVIEQSQHLAPEHKRRLAELNRDRRVRIFEHHPLGGPRARNVGARAARGEIIVFMDDDDLPASDRWLAAHVANFEDPHCLAVTGRQLMPDKPDPPYRNMDRARRQVCSYVPLLMWQRVYTSADRRRVVDNVHGGNVSVRRSVLARVGLWDECTPIEDELSFNYRLRRARTTDEYVLFDPAALMIRRRDIPGGMGKRDMAVTRLGERMFEFLHRIVAYYFPLRFILLYPAYVALVYIVCCDWIWHDLHDRGSKPQRVLRMAWLFVALPLLWIMWSARLLARRVRAGAPRIGIERVPVLQ